MADIQYEPDPSKYPGFTGIGYPDVFTTMPPQPSEKKVGQLPPEKVKEFFEQVNTYIHLYVIVTLYLALPFRLIRLLLLPMAVKELNAVLRTFQQTYPILYHVIIDHLFTLVSYFTRPISVNSKYERV